MDDVRDMLIETFEAHQPPTPDSLDVLTNVDAIAKAHRRNRWALRTAGISLVSAGIVAGSLGVSGLLSSSASRGPSVEVGSSTGTGTGTQTANPPSEQDELTAFWDAGYDYNDAVKLAQAWNEPNKVVTKVKAEAGLKLLNGETLPVPPSGAPATPEDKDVQAFFNAGYDYYDAQKLASMWNESTYQAKIDGGKKLEAGQPLPFKPGTNDPTTPAANPMTVTQSQTMLKKAIILKRQAAIKSGAAYPASTDTSPPPESPALTAYFNAGYDYTNAQQLAKLWNETDINQVKTEAGQKLLNGETLPVKPDGSPAPPENKYVSDFFAAGYTINDAIELGKMWNESTYQAKIDGGKKLDDGQTLPIKPGS